MTIMTLDTSMRSIVGLVEERRELAVEISPDSRHHAETLIPMIERVQAAAREGEPALPTRPELIVVGTGPAAFTGLRAGLMTARALGRGWEVPVVGVSSLEVLALGGSRIAESGGEVLAVIDARRKELFVLRARAMGTDDIEVLDGPTIMKPDELPALLDTRPALLLTPNPGLYPQLSEACEIACTPLLMADLARSRVARYEAGEDVNLSTEPQYLRRPDIHGV